MIILKCTLCIPDSLSSHRSSVCSRGKLLDANLPHVSTVQAVNLRYYPPCSNEEHLNLHPKLRRLYRNHRLKLQHKLHRSHRPRLLPDPDLESYFTHRLRAPAASNPPASTSTHRRCRLHYRLCFWRAEPSCPHEPCANIYPNCDYISIDWPSDSPHGIGFGFVLGCRTSEGRGTAIPARRTDRSASNTDSNT